MKNVSSQYGQTALQRASSYGHADVVKLLVDSGAQIDNKDIVSTEPFMVLHCDSFLTISISPLHTLTLSLSLALVPYPAHFPVGNALVVVSLF